MAWTEQLPSGRYRGGYRVGKQKRYTDDTYTHKRAAERAATKLEEESRELGWHDPRAAERTWGEWADEWAPAYYAEKSTARATASMISKRIRPKWGDTRLRDITRQDVRAWATELRAADLAPTTVKRIIAAFSSSLSGAVDAEILPANPALRLKLRIPDNLSERVLTLEQQAALFAALPTDLDRALVGVLLGTGFRSGEAVALEPAHISVEHRTFRARQSWDQLNRVLVPYTKGKARRTVPAADWVFDLVTPLLRARRHGYLFAARDGDPIDLPNWRKRVWTPAVEASGINEGESEPATPHTLRHTYATEQLEAGRTIAEIADLLGHESVTTTERYAHRRSRVDPAAANAIRDPRKPLPKPDPEPTRRTGNVVHVNFGR